MSNVLDSHGSSEHQNGSAPEAAQKELSPFQKRALDRIVADHSATVDLRHADLPKAELPQGMKQEAHSAISVSGISDGTRFEYLMSNRIEGDNARYKEIVKGAWRKDLKKYIKNHDMIGRKGDDLVSIPMPQIDPPRFRFGQNGNGGAGQGDGEPGDPMGGKPQQGDGSGQAGENPGEHTMEVEVTIDELAQALGDELELPRIQPKGKKNIINETDKYTGIRPTGPEGLLNRRRSFFEALKRQIASGEYNPDEPEIVMERPDKLYKSSRIIHKPEVNAVVIYMMDVSGSMTDEQKAIVRTESFWIDTWLKSQYKGLETRYIIHDASAKVVDEHTFYNTRESGGTRISSAYEVAHNLIQKDFPPSEWNVYCFHFTDGDNWGDDNSKCMELLREKLLPECNMFGYGQVESPYGSGEFLRYLKKESADEIENLATSEIRNRDGILDSIKDFLGRGK